MAAFFLKEKYILIFFAFLSFATVMSYVDLSPEGQTQVKSLKELRNDSRLDFDRKSQFVFKNDLSRTPASVDQNEQLILEKEFLCKTDKGVHKKVSDRTAKNLVAINFKLCHELKLIDHLEIGNKSNGFKAHIFNMKKNFYKTDFIQLNSGLNLLKLEVFLKDGQKIEETLEILSGT